MFLSVSDLYLNTYTPAADLILMISALVMLRSKSITMHAVSHMQNMISAG